VRAGIVLASVPSVEPAVASFFHLHEVPLGPCRGLACFVARHDDPARWQEACEGGARVHCLGRCYRAPAVPDDRSQPLVRVDAPEPVVLRHVGPHRATSLDAYRARGGYRALAQARAMAPADIIDTIERAELRGRGGAGFPTGRKWRAVRQQAGRPLIVVNADEGDPGAYIDRMIVEDCPHSIIEAAAIAGLATGARAAYVYLRREYPEAGRRFDAALAEARAAGVLDEGGETAMAVHLVQGHGSYVCGEETALLNAIEGRRPAVRARPPYPATAGLFGRPTLVANVETLANVPWIVEHGADAYRAMGRPGSRGTKAVSLNSLFVRPGLYEVEFGATLRHIVDDLGGGLRTGALRGVIVGGPLAGVVPPRLLDTPLGFAELQTIGASVGHGGIVAFDTRTTIRELAAHVSEFAAYESCGTCTPCRLGASRLAARFHHGEEGAHAVAAHVEVDAIVDALAAASLCGLGTGLADFARSLQRHYPDEWTSCCMSSSTAVW
jgi:NADH:ubiquinone oxidoreductase subunit F (NADH-binding)